MEVPTKISLIYFKKNFKEIFIPSHLQNGIGECEYLLFTLQKLYQRLTSTGTHWLSFLLILLRTWLIGNCAV